MRLRIGGGLGSVLFLVMLQCVSTASAGMLGYPVPRLEPLHVRLELAGDSFQEKFTGDIQGDVETARGLVSVALGLTNWVEIYGRFGAGDFNVSEALFNGDFNLAYGGGVRVRLLRFPWGQIGLMGQYLRFTSDDSNAQGIRIDGEWEEFDAALGLGTRRFGAFQLYAGGAYHMSDVILRQEGPEADIRLETDIPYRLFVGANIYPLADFPAGQFVVNVEARFIGEIPQFTIGLQYAF